MVSTQTSKRWNVSRANFLSLQREISARERRRVQIQMMPGIFQQNKPFYLLPRTANLLPLKTASVRVKEKQNKKRKKKKKFPWKWFKMAQRSDKFNRFFFSICLMRFPAPLTRFSFALSQQLLPPEKKKTIYFRWVSVAVSFYRQF